VLNDTKTIIEILGKDQAAKPHVETGALGGTSGDATILGKDEAARLNIESGLFGKTSGDATILGTNKAGEVNLNIGQQPNGNVNATILEGNGSSSANVSLNSGQAEGSAGIGLLNASDLATLDLALGIAPDTHLGGIPGSGNGTGAGNGSGGNGNGVKAGAVAGIGGAYASMTPADQQLLKTKCRNVLSSQGNFAPKLVLLCKMIASL
jgi:hypothetical protein